MERAELLLLEGRRAGARVALAPGRRIVLGGAFDCDVVARERGVPGRALELVVGDASEPVRIVALATGVTLDGEPLEPGEERALGPDARIGVGDAAFALAESPVRAPAEPDALARDAAAAVAARRGARRGTGG